MPDRDENRGDVPPLSAFAGRWRVARTIDDRLAGLAGRFEGDVTFTPEADGLVYREDGWLSYGAATPVRAGRSYRWGDSGAGIDVFFEDGRFFHQIGAAGAAEHLCGADLYAVVYDFGAWPDWSLVWEVRGPRKDYRMAAAYTRASD